MNLLYRITDLQCLGHDEDTHVGRLVECLLDIRDLYLVVLHKSMHALSYHPQSLLQGFLEGPSDSHDLTH